MTQMPGLLALQAELRSQGYRILIIVIAGYPNQRHRDRAVDGGAARRPT